MMTWLFISAIGVGVVIAVAVISYEPPFDETQERDSRKSTVGTESTFNGHKENSMS